MPEELFSLFNDAVQWYLASPRNYDLGPPGPRTRTLGQNLDCVLQQADRWDEPDLAACLLVLAIARRDRADGLQYCLRALRHALADLQLDLPLPPGPGPMRPVGQLLPLQDGLIDDERAKDLCCVLGEIGYVLPLEELRHLTAAQADQAENYARRLKLRLTEPIDVPERPPFLSLL
jgi:hypothetical protein